MAVLRRCAKVLLVDEEGRVLLFCAGDRTKPDVAPWWAPVGGALDEGETSVEAAVREVREETGAEIGDPGPVVMTRRFQWDFEGQAFDQHEDYFLVRTPQFEPADDGWTETERATVVAHRWWSPEELRATEEVVFPEGLADLLDRL